MNYNVSVWDCKDKIRIIFFLHFGSPALDGSYSVTSFSIAFPSSLSPGLYSGYGTESYLLKLSPSKEIKTAGSVACIFVLSSKFHHLPRKPSAGLTCVGLDVRKYVIIRGGDDIESILLFLRPFWLTGNRSYFWNSRRSLIC